MEEKKPTKPTPLAALGAALERAVQDLENNAPLNPDSRIALAKFIREAGPVMSMLDSRESFRKLRTLLVFMWLLNTKKLSPMDALGKKLSPGERLN